MSWFDSLVKIDFERKFDTVIYSAVAIFFSYLIFTFIQRQRKASVLNKIPGPKTVPIFGNSLDLLVKPAEFFKVFTTDFCKNPEGISRIWIGSDPYCFVYRANALETLLSSSKLLKKSSDYKSLEVWLGTGLLTATGVKWHRRRKMLTPAFHFKILEDFIEVFNQQSQVLVRNLQEKSDGKTFNIFPYITLCTLDIILETAMGRSINAQGNMNSDYVTAVYKIGRIFLERQTRPWLQIGILFKLFGYEKTQKECLSILHGLSNDTIRDRKKEREKNKKQNINKEEAEVLGQRKRLAFLDLLLEFSEENETLTDEDIREEVDTFMFEGHDTTAASLNFTLYLLGRYPEIQSKVYEELESIFGKSEREATSSDLREMKYLECCIKESLRLFPSVPMFGRQMEQDTTIGGYVVPKGTNVMVITYRLHRDPNQFPNPNEFNPERFVFDSSEKKNPYSYVPFSAGPRNCIGQKFALMEEKIIISTFLRKYRVESIDKMEDLKLTGDLILRPETETLIKIFPRN